jgi:hypothetical protein
MPKVVCASNKYTRYDDILSRYYIDIKGINKITNYSYISYFVKIFIYLMLNLTVILSIRSPIFCLLKSQL